MPLMPVARVQRGFLAGWRRLDVALGLFAGRFGFFRRGHGGRCSEDANAESRNNALARDRVRSANGARLA